ncbi:hypothetical protein [Allobranchiibius sp. GilTou73]|uniref:hypothetical protein n=1 Tax=Allobranchiibius sp. GilTou73 TaxID=2904523 RepID=UPI001F418EF2|nr:hypothetical protein [Allobranchiibius sp. GilTou73]UIJ35237.1 hypothetical protein LVQ62_02275 [Allobranchiibius sp. GilTou73]
MPWGKSDEEKQVEAAQRKLQAQQAEEQRAREAFLRTPVGQATEAKKRGDRFFEAQLDAAQLKGAASAFGSSDNTVRRHAGAPDTLGQIEEIGWRLEHVSHAFIETGATTTNRMLGTGQGMVTRGVVTGFYLFRNAD